MECLKVVFFLYCLDAWKQVIEAVHHKGSQGYQVPLACISLVEARGDPAILFIGADQPHAAKTLDFILDILDNQSPVLIGGGYEPDTAAEAIDGHYAK
ncbi:NADPH2 dehydrogenase [Microdochium nivale]|nr:NADPH2 dehydrogenase [Microdochium nivale]